MNSNTKKASLIFRFASFAIVVILLSSYTATAQDNDSTKLKAASEKLIESKKDFKMKYEAFKLEADSKIAEDEKEIVKLKAEIKEKNKSAQEDLDKKVDVLEGKIQMQKEKIRDYKEADMDKWESFKLEFNHDMDNLGQALKDITKNNTK